MLPISKRKAMQVLRECGAGRWTTSREPNGIGDYGYDETYSLNGEPVLRVRVEFIHATVKSYDLRGPTRPRVN
jgi:hypothetical protein